MIIYFSGGLGNQLFQYALYLSAKQKGYQVRADLSWYDKNNSHNGFELHNIFGLKLEIENEKIKMVRNDIISRGIRKIGFKKYGINSNVITEKNSEYIPDLLCEENQNKLLMGYWQSEKYFNTIRKELLNNLKFPNLTENNISTLKDILENNSVSVHVRRGDYVDISLYNNLGSSNYYNNAINLIKTKYDNPKFFVFSDDIAWCRVNLDLPDNAVFIDWNKGKSSYIDMQLMSMCKHNIIANSSFSWWGAWLNCNPTKIVVAPESWFSPGYGFNESNIIPSSWIKLN